MGPANLQFIIRNFLSGPFSLYGHLIFTLNAIAKIWSFFRQIGTQVHIAQHHNLKLHRDNPMSCLAGSDLKCFHLISEPRKTPLSNHPSTEPIPVLWGDKWGTSVEVTILLQRYLLIHIPCTLKRHIFPQRTELNEIWTDVAFNRFR